MGILEMLAADRGARLGGFAIRVEVVVNGFILEYDVDRSDMDEPVRRLIARNTRELDDLLRQVIEDSIQRSDKKPGALRRSAAEAAELERLAAIAEAEAAP